MLTYLIYGLAVFGAIETLRRTYEYKKELRAHSEILLLTGLNLLTIIGIGYIISVVLN